MFTMQNFIDTYPNTGAGQTYEIDTNYYNSLVSYNTNFVMSKISNRYPDGISSTTIQSIVDKCIMDLIYVEIIKQNTSALNDGGWSILYKNTITIINEISNGVIADNSDITPTTDPTKSCWIVSSEPYYKG